MKRESCPKRSKTSSLLRGNVGINMPLIDLSEQRLRFYRQIGVEEVTLPSEYSINRLSRAVRPFVPPAQTRAVGPQPEPWNESELRRIQERVRVFDLLPTTMALRLSGNILMGRPGRDEDIECVKEDIRVAGRVGVRVLVYTFTALRASEGYGACVSEGRGSANLRDFDYDRIHDLAPLSDVGRHSLEQMWENLECFLHQVIPVAEEAAVRLAVHPTDPPVPDYRGVAQPLSNFAEMKQLIKVIDSPANTIFFDTGVATEWGEDVVEVIDYFGKRDRIGMVHFRNVQVQTPPYKYLETFIDDGDCDMLAAMRGLKSVGYSGGLDPDHTPSIISDTIDTRMGWAFAVGHIRALRNAAEHE